MLRLYDRQVWGVVKDYSQDQINAVSLLARLELAGVDVGDRWQDVASHLAARLHDHVLPFLDVQYLYGLARAGRPEADALLRQHRGHAPRCRAPRSACLAACGGAGGARRCWRMRAATGRALLNRWGWRCRDWPRSAAATPSATCSSSSTSTR